MTPLELLALALPVASAVMTVVWVTSVRMKNAGIVDVAWSANFGLLALLSAPFALAVANETARLSWIEGLGLALWTVGFAGEAIADRQLDRFRRDPANRGRTCRVGLWRLSRHPNYFFEWLVWVAFFVFACGSPWGFLTVYCPAVMLWFLFRVTGIPATEAHALRSRGEEYREYQRTTSAFVPWFPRG